MSQQECFEFAREPEPSAKAQRRDSEAEINRKLRQMQAMPDGPAKDAAAQEILNWILER